LAILQYLGDHFKGAPTISATVTKPAAKFFCIGSFCSQRSANMRAIAILLLLMVSLAAAAISKKATVPPERNSGLDAACVTRPPSVVISSSKDRDGQTWVFSYTQEELVLKDPVQWLKDRLGYNAIAKKHQEIACERFKRGMKLQHSGDEPAAQKEFEAIRLELDGRKAAGGFGTYFSPEPFSSADYGPYMIAVAIPAGKKFGHFKHPITDKNHLDLILSDEAGIVYSWIVPALVARDVSIFEQKDGSIKCWAAQVQHLPAGKEIWKLGVYWGGFNLHRFIQQYGDWMLWARFARFPSQLDDSIRMSMIMWQINRKFENRKLVDLHKLPGSLDDVVYALSPDYPIKLRKWQNVIEYLVQIQYVPSSARDLPEMDRAGLVKLAIENFRRRGDRATESLLKGLQRIKMSTLLDWKEPQL
jgi:hypothetical protein